METPALELLIRFIISFNESLSESIKNVCLLMVKYPSLTEPASAVSSISWSKSGSTPAVETAPKASVSFNLV